MAQRYPEDSGMDQLAQIVAGLYKDVKLIKSASNLAGAQRYASKHKGWVATKEDITGPNKVPDGVDEILIRDKHGNIRVVNGWTTIPSKFAERQAYYDNVPTWTEAELASRTDLTPMGKKLMVGRPKFSMKKFKHDFNEMVPDIVNGIYTGKWNYGISDFEGNGVKAMRGDRIKPAPKALFTQMIKEVWDHEKERIPVENRLDVYRVWSNGEYLTKVVIPSLTAIGVEYNSLPYKEDVAKQTNKKHFKDAALRILYDYSQNSGEFYDDVGGDLSEIINRNASPDILTQLYGEQKPYKPRD